MAKLHNSLMGALIFLVLSCAHSIASDVEIVKVTFENNGGTYNFHVTLRHSDTGWDHYANSWRVEGQNGEIYGTRELAHPHVREQPFTRSLSGIKIPAGVGRVLVRAGDNIAGLTPGGKLVELAD